MPTVWIPSLMRNLTDGVEKIKLDAVSVGQIVTQLDEKYPGFRKRICDEQEDRIRPNIAIMVDGRNVKMGLQEKVGQNSEVHFLPAIKGG